MAEMLTHKRGLFAFCRSGYAKHLWMGMDKKCRAFFCAHHSSHPHKALAEKPEKPCEVSRDNKYAWI